MASFLKRVANLKAMLSYVKPMGCLPDNCFLPWDYHLLKSDGVQHGGGRCDGVTLISLVLRRSFYHLQLHTESVFQSTHYARPSISRSVAALRRHHGTAPARFFCAPRTDLENWIPLKVESPSRAIPPFGHIRESVPRPRDSQREVTVTKRYLF